MIEKEFKQVEIKIGRETKLVEIWRYSTEVLWTCYTPFLVRYRTGNKVHRIGNSIAFEGKDGKWFLRSAFRNAHPTIIGWDNGEIAVSKWRG